MKPHCRLCMACEVFHAALRAWSLSFWKRTDCRACGQTWYDHPFGIKCGRKR